MYIDTKFALRTDRHESKYFELILERDGSLYITKERKQGYPLTTVEHMSGLFIKDLTYALSVDDREVGISLNAINGDIVDLLIRPAYISEDTRTYNLSVAIISKEGKIDQVCLNRTVTLSDPDHVVLNRPED